MKIGDSVFVFQVGDVKRVVQATVVIASKNENSLILSFGEAKPIFWEHDSLAIHPAFGLVLVLLRDDTTAPFWKDIFAGHRYGISVPG